MRLASAMMVGSEVAVVASSLEAAVEEASHADLAIGIASRQTVTTSTGHGGIFVIDVKPQNPLSTATTTATETSTETATAAATTPTTEMLIGKY